MVQRNTSMVALLALVLTMGCKQEDEGMDPNADADGDGITNGDEMDLGTDPNEADSDGDGFDDAAEWREGTNPNYEYSHSYQGDYRVGFCDTPPATTGPTMAQSIDANDGNTYNYNVLQNGDVPENFTMVDQYGEELDLYSFCGQPVMVVLSAGWCGPCRAEAETLQAVADAYPDLQIITMLTDDNAYEIPTVPFLESWANQYGFENIAVVTPGGTAPTTYDELFAQPQMAWEMDGYIPTIYHLDETLTVISADEGMKEPPAN